jgi:hypothetical protein
VCIVVKFSYRNGSWCILNYYFLVNLAGEQNKYCRVVRMFRRFPVHSEDELVVGAGAIRRQMEEGDAHDAAYVETGLRI